MASYKHKTLRKFHHMKIRKEHFMIDLELKFYAGAGGEFFVTHIDPFTKIKVRKRFGERASALNYKSELETKYQSDLSGKVGDFNVNDLLIQFMKDLPENHFMKNRWLFADFNSTFGNLKIKELTSGVLKSWLQQLQIEGNYTPRTMETFRVYTNHFFRYLIKKKITTDSPAKGIRYVQHEAELTRKPTLLKPDQIEDLKQKAKKFSPGYFYPIFLVASNLAAKTTEITNIKWDHVNLKNNTITLIGLKTLAQRTLKMSDELTSCLQNKKRGSDFVFTNLYGKQFNKKQLGYAMTEFKRYYKIKEKWMYFDLRHSFARNYLEAGGKMKELQYILGIRSIDTAREIYGYHPKSNLTLKSPFEIGV